MKRQTATLLILILIVGLLVSCSKEVVIDLPELRDELLAADLFTDQLVSLSTDKIPVEAEVDSSLYISAEYWKGSGITGEEIGLFRCGSNKDAKELEKQLIAHRDSLYELYASYKPEALPRINNAVIRCKGSYVVFVSAENYQLAGRIVDSYFS